MKKALLLTIAALVISWSAMAQTYLQFGGGWQTGDADVTYNSGDVINIKITGAGENEYDRLHLSSGNFLAGGAQLNVFSCYTPAPGDRFVIFKAPTIDGEFSNPPLIDTGGNFFVLSYEKENDNDNDNDIVVLTALAKLFGLDISTSGATTTKPDYNYTLTVVAEPEAGGNVNVNPTQATYKVCDEIDIQATANTGFRFVEWTQIGSAIIANTASLTTTATMPARAVIITANFCELPGAPVANNATGVTTNSFTANWEEATGAITYTLEVSQSSEFDAIESYTLSAGTLSKTVSVVLDCGSITHYYRVKATNDCGTTTSASTASVTISVTVTDIDGNEYNTILIGNQCWMKENLRVTKYNNNDAIPTGLSDAAWESTTSGAYAIYPHGSIDGLNSDEDVLQAYGALYNWYAVHTGNLCPEGWSVPSDAEWTQLVDYVVAQGFPNEWNDSEGAANALKSCRQVNSPAGDDCDTSKHPRWNSDGTHSGFDEFGFSALPGGRRWSSGSFLDVGYSGYWWSATEVILPTLSWYRSMNSGNGFVFRSGNDKTNGFSVRCLRGY